MCIRDSYRDSGAGIVAATGNSISFTLVSDNDTLDNDNDTIPDEMGELKTIKYDLYDAYSDGDNDIGRQVGSANSTKRAVAENIEEIEFYYTLADGTNATAPDTDDYSEIRSVQIAILARAEREDSKFSNTKTYYTTLLGVDWGPYNDGFRRRLLSTTVKCRNMGL